MKGKNVPFTSLEVWSDQPSLSPPVGLFIKNKQDQVTYLFLRYDQGLAVYSHILHR